jgi:predicted DNA-binding transcriptional regulator YafY
MSKRESISRYALIIQKLRRGAATFQEISDYLDRESEVQAYNFRVSKRTFDRDKEDIASLYNIEIKYDFSLRKYKIDSELEPEANERILEAFDTFNALNLSDRLSNYIHFEKRKPEGTEHLYGLLHAIKNALQIKFQYHKYWEDTTTNRTLEPLALKEFAHRWYVLGKDIKDNRIKSFALDRIRELEIEKVKFTIPANFDLNAYYKDCFGIISPDAKHKLEDIVLSFDPIQGKYIKSLPLHESQQILVDNDDEIRIKLTVYPTFDFLQEVLSHGSNVKVIAPDSFAMEVKRELQKAINAY